MIVGSDGVTRYRGFLAELTAPHARQSATIAVVTVHPDTLDEGDIVAAARARIKALRAQQGT
jgi:hypothetical protein